MSIVLTTIFTTVNCDKFVPEVVSFLFLRPSPKGQIHHEFRQLLQVRQTWPLCPRVSFSRIRRWERGSRGPGLPITEWRWDRHVVHSPRTPVHIPVAAVLFCASARVRVPLAAVLWRVSVGSLGCHGFLLVYSALGRCSLVQVMTLFVAFSFTSYLVWD